MYATLLQGKTIGVPARSYVYSMIQCINADYVDIPNRVPWSIIDGTSLHFKYSGNANMNYRTGNVPATLTVPPFTVFPPTPDYVPQQIDVEFESPSTFTVPFDGTLTFMGGNQGIGQKGPADFKVYVYYDDRPCSGRPDDPIDTSNYAPMFHWLKHYSDPLVPFIFSVPDNHTYLLGQNPTDVFTVNGVTVQPGVNAPGMIVSPGDRIGAPPNKVVITGWLG